MSSVKTTSTIPIEFFILIVAPIVIFVICSYISPNAINGINNLFTSNSTVQFLFFGIGFFRIAFFIIYNYLIFKTAFILKKILEYYFLQKRDQRKKNQGTIFFHSVLMAIKSIITLFLLFLIPSIIILANMKQIGSVSAQETINASNFLMYLDYSLFGAYVPFSLQQFSHIKILDTLFLSAYTNLSTIISIIFILLLIKNIDLLRRFITAFFVVVMISIPLWYSFPALTPSEMYKNNVTTTTIDENIKNTISFYLEKTSPRNSRLIDTISNIGSKPEEGYYSVSTFPSMHTAWGLLVLYFSFLIWAPFGIATFFWYILNIIGAMYTLEHYAVDIVSGVIIGVIGIIAVNYVFSRTKKSTEYPEFFFGIEVIRRDIRRFINNRSDIFFKIKTLLKSFLRHTILVIKKFG